MLDPDQIRPIKERVEAQLRKYPGVHAVGIGEKYVEGKPSGEMSILVLVTKKKSAENLKPEEIVPAEIEGIKTDVIEVPMPGLAMAGNPADLTAAIDATQRIITFSGKTKPGAGLIVMVEFTGTPTTATPPFFVVSYETQDGDTLDDIARNVGTQLTHDSGFPGVTATSSGATCTVAPPATPAGATVTVVNVVISAIDDKQYFDQWIRGGIQLGLTPDVHGSGTLGCLATTAATADDPQGKVVGITNHHVVLPDTTWGTNLVATLNPAIAGQIILASKDGNPITPNTLLEIMITATAGRESALYLTRPGDTPTSVAAGAATVVGSLGIAGLVATPAPTTLTITGVSMNFQVRGPLSAKGNFSGAVDRNTITYTGEVDGDDYGIYVNVHPGGLAPSFGLFVNPPKKLNGDGMATRVLNAFNSLPAAVRGTVTMTQSGNKITVANAQLIESRITDDIRVGQPDPSFGSSCCHCCSHRIGRVLDARLDLDVAVIQLDAEQKYKPEVQGFGLVTGMQPPAQPMTVTKQGRTLQGSQGLVRGLNVSGFAAGNPRLYTNSFLIQSTTRDRFSAPGDSGSAVLDLSRNVVGLLWGSQDIWAYATPMNLIVAAYPALALNFAPAPAAGHAATDVRTVPKPAHMQATPEAVMEGTPVMVGQSLQDRLLEAEREVSAIPIGREYADLVRRHFDEGQRLINGNRRVATVWHRNGGPELLQAIFRMIQRGDQRIPVRLNDKPLAQCLYRVLRVMARYASPRLSADLRQHAPRLAGLAGLGYEDVLALLQSWSEER